MAISIFDYLDRIRERPTLYIQKLSDLESQIWGYLSALRQHSVYEPVPSMGLHFHSYVGEQTGWGISQGWACAIEERFEGLDDQLEQLFSLVDSYRQLVPKELATADLDSTAENVSIGSGNATVAPTSVDIIQYYPQPLHFLRLRYDARFDDMNLLFNKELGHRTTIEDAKIWVSREFGFPTDGWTEIA